MILSVYQPYFFPYPGFFYKAALSDFFVILDAVQFPRGTTWLTRNRFKNDKGVLRITVPVWKKGLGLQKINEVRICHEGNWAEKHLASLTTAYRHAPYAREHIPFLETVFTRGYDRLVDLNWAVLHYLMTCLGMKTKMIRLSELNIRKGGDDLLIELCGELGASQFLAQGSAKKYLKRAFFEKAGVTLRFFNPPDWVYPQLWGSFISNLSTLDMLLNCGPKSRDILLKS